MKVPGSSSFPPGRRRPACLSLSPGKSARRPPRERCWDRRCTGCWSVWILPGNRWGILWRIRYGRWRRTEGCWRTRSKESRWRIFGDGSASEEMLLVQGIIDVFFEEEDGIVLLDYKTDRVREAEELIRRYRRQLELYGEALERTRGKRVKERYLYSFALGETIRV